MEIEEFSARFTSLLESSRTSVEGLFKAASTGELAPFQHLVEGFKSEELFLKMALGVFDENCKSFLHVAAARGRKKLCKLLLEEGKLDINVKDCEAGETPLHHAIKEGHFPTAAFLLENGADPNSRSKKRRTSLHYATEYGSKELMELLISKGADINAVADCGTPLQYAAGKGKDEFVKLLLDHHADPNVISHDLFSPLLASIQAQSLECMELLLKVGANPNFHGSKGMTPLGYAASEGLKEFIICLLNAGADPNIANNLGMTPIEEAALANKRRVVRILFPRTSPIPTIREWSISGLLKQIHSDETREKRELKLKELFLISKSKGAKSFISKDYFRAVLWYTEAISCNPNDATVLSERSLSWAKMNEGGLALEDAKACIKLSPNWSEAYHREGVARMLLKEFEKAACAFFYGFMLDPENKAIECAFRESIEAQKDQNSFLL